MQQFEAFPENTLFLPALVQRGDHSPQAVNVPSSVSMQWRTAQYVLEEDEEEAPEEEMEEDLPLKPATPPTVEEEEFEEVLA